MTTSRSLRAALILSALVATVPAAVHAQTVKSQSIVVNPTSPVSVGSLTLINAATGQPVPGFNPIQPGATLNLAALPKSLSIRANPVGTVQSVRFGLDSNLNYHSENIAPFSLCDGSDCAEALRPGQHTVIATPYTGANASGQAGLGLSVTYSVVNVAQAPTPAPAFAVTSITLINADTNQPVPGYDPIQPGARLQLSALPKRLNFRANTSGNVRSVRFIRTGNRQYVENEAPFAYCGDTKGGNGKKGDYLACDGAFFTAGTHQLSATPFTQMFAKGTMGGTYTVPYSVTP
ncbi:hypothetical protein HNQ07_002913 [Deinococcus metalli]|uniref:Uncharacterized protein n=1 Tax=Deinococcus metalli TaxID=1141878 RepID=A0A7W8NQ17_9DEIO|nr:hypothetical protein [Deinococcus metalli]MBB5377421.1 hypothetical protein [Deinococcus metalli]GHF50287.1 hypothetical protein GCM10017781_28490 [Deinococcus metalli]